MVESLERRALITGVPAVTAGPAFFGPLGGWLMAPAATGNANTDTANLQNDLNLVGTAGNSNTLYIPAGTYLINQSLVFRGKSEVTVIGADPATTIIQWAGPLSTASAQAMLIDYGNTITQLNRITLNGLGQVALGISDGYHPNSGISQQGAFGALSNGGASAFYGVAFTTENVTEKVNQLQLWVPANTTTTQAHTLELIDASTGLVINNGALTIPAGRIGGASGAWITNNLPADAILAANHTYYLVAQEFNGGDSWYSDATPMGPDYVTVASVNGSVSNAGGSFGIVTPGNHSFGPVKFNIDTAGDFFPTNDQFLYDHLTNFTGAGLDVGAIAQAAETTVEGCQFSYCGTNTGNPIGSGAGIYLFGQNTIDWWIRNCEFDHDSVGIATNFGGFSMDVDNSVFNSNTLMDVYVPFGYSSAIRNSTSINSAQFVGGGSGTAVILQNDTIIDPTSTTTPPINLKSAQLVLLNTIIRNNAGYLGPDISVTTGGDILSQGNTFGVNGGGAYNPYLYAGTAILDALGNQTLSLISPAMQNLAPQALPAAPALTNFPIIELTPTGVANTDTASIKSAISTAKTDIDNGAAGAVIHMRGGLTINNTAGSFNINSTVTIPAGYAIELLGDGAVYQGSGNSGTALTWLGPRGGTMLDLGGATLGVTAGPSCATITGMGILGGDSAGDGIRVENADQVGGNVYSDYSLAGTDGNDTPAIYTQTGLFADGLSNTNVQMADFNADAQYSVKVVGGASPGSGGQVGVFMGAGASTNTQYDVSNGGKLLVEDQYLEEDTGATNQFAHVDNATFTLQGAEIKANVAGVEAANPPISVSGTSNVSILSSQAAAGIILQPGATSNLLATGNGQWGSSSGAASEMGPFDGPLDYAAPSSQVALVANGNFADQVNANVMDMNAFLQKMLAQTLSNRVQPLPIAPSRTVTDVRIYGVDVVSCVNDIHLVGSSPAPVLSNPPSPMTPAAPTNVIAQTSGNGGNQVNLSFTPGGAHLIASNDFALGLGNAHNMGLVNNTTGNVGMQFTTGAAPIVVTQLGRYVVPGNTQAHTLQIVQAATLTVVASATLQASGAQANAFGYASLATPVTLAPNTQYYLVSAETAGGDQYVASAVIDSTSIVKSIDAAGTLTGGVWTSSATSGASFDFSNGPLDLVAETLPHLSGEGITSGVTTGALAPVTSNFADEGFRFTTGANAVTVTNLGRWIVKNTTTTQPHTLELVDPANGNAVIASTTLAAGQIGGVNGQFEYAPLAVPVVLAANHSYYLVSQEYAASGSDQTYANNTQMTPGGLVASSDGAVSYNGSVWTFTADPATTSEVYHYTYGPLDLLGAVDQTPVSYNIYRSTDPHGAAATLIASNLTTTSYLDSPGGAAGISYYYQVTAVNSSGESAALGAPSASLGTVLPGGWSDANIGPVAGSAWTNSGNATSFTVQGNGSQMTQWNYAYEPIATGSSFTETAYVNSMTWADGPATGYDEFRAALMVRNGLAATGNSVAYVDVSASFAQLNGTNGSSVIAPVWLQLRANYASNNHTYTITGWYSHDGVNWSAAGINSPAIIGLPGNLYVGLAVNSYGTVGLTTAVFTNVSVIDASIAAPAAPTALTATAVGNSAVNLFWTAPAGTSNYYNVYRATMPGGEGITPYATGILGTSFQDANISSSGAYYYTVAAINEGGVGAQSNEATASVAPVATKLAFIQQPTSGNVDQTIGNAANPAVIVNVEDQFGNLDSLDNSSVTLAVNTGPGTIGGSVTVQAINGVATFTSLTFDTPGTYTLVATDGSLTSALSASIAIGTAAGISPASGSAYTLAGSPGSQTLDVTRGIVTLTADLSATMPNYTLAIEDGAKVVLASGQHLGQLLLNGNATLDLGTHSLTINYGSNPSPNAAIRSYIAGAYTNGLWTGSGITSSWVKSSPNVYAIGFADGADNNVVGLAAGTFVVEPTFIADANLDGKVDFYDFIILSNHFGVPDINWDHGNFNFDSNVDFADFIALSNHFGAVMTLPGNAVVTVGAARASSTAANDVLTSTPAAITSKASTSSRNIEPIVHPTRHKSTKNNRR